MNVQKKRTPLCLVCTIVERGAGQKVALAYEKHGLELHYRVSGEGTASSDLLDILGIGTSERDILISPAPRGAVDRLVGEIHQAGIGVRAKGIMCVMPLTAASAKVAGALLSGAAAEEEDAMEHTINLKQSLILICVDHGYTDAVMATAKAAGARGGTVIRSHILKDEAHANFGGPTFAGEREIIVIAASQRERNAIMESVDRVHGGDAAAHAILYSLPLEQAAHLS